jgi:hypothetical protein
MPVGKLITDGLVRRMATFATHVGVDVVVFDDCHLGTQSIGLREDFLYNPQLGSSVVGAELEEGTGWSEIDDLSQRVAGYRLHHFVTH